MPNPPANSDYDRLIPPEVKADPFYHAILSLARTEKLRTVLEIGSSSGEGSTEAFILGLRENLHRPTLFCMEISKPRFEALRDRYASDGFVKPYRVSSVPPEKFPSEEEATRFYTTHLAGRFVPLPEFLRWLRQDLEYIRSSGVPTEGIKLIKEENEIRHFDLVLIDGSEFSGEAELQEVYGARLLLLDDINSYKNFANARCLIADANYILREANEQVRGGYAIFEQILRDSPGGPAITPDERRLLSRRIKPGMSVCDVGTNIGDTAIFLSRLVRTEGRVLALDCGPAPDASLAGRFAENDCDNVHLVHASAGTGAAAWLDDLARDEKISRIDFLRIDGSAAVEVLRGAADLLRRNAIRFICFAGTGEPPAAALEILSQHGYEMRPENGNGSTGSDTQQVGGGFLAQPRLPVHFFTIALNGLPYLRHHIEQFKQLGFDWHWHIAEGVADLKHDTAWSVAAGGKVPAAFHSGGRSVDGTSEYLDQLVKAHPDRVTVYRKPPGQHWDGKVEMVSAPLNAIAEDCLLWQIDADELWTAEQFAAGRQLFLQHPTKTAAMYWCWFFVGPDLVISTRNCYANNPQGEWLRTWRYSPGMRWFAHEPPTLGEQLPDGRWRSVAQTDPLLHGQTEAAGLVFQHYAYATENQVRFKQDYYGYRSALERWQALQASGSFPVALRNFFPWVQDHTQVDRAAKYVARKLIDLPARSPVPAEDVARPRAVIEPAPTITLRQPGGEPKIVIDGVFFQMYQTGIARVWSSLLQTWAADGFARQIVVLDRGNSVPKIPGVRCRTMRPYDYNRTDEDRRLLQQICDEESASVFISSYYTTPITTPSVFMAHDMIPELFGWDLSHPMWREKHAGIRHASAFVCVSHQTKADLMKYFPQIEAVNIAVTPLACDPTFRPRPKAETDALRETTQTRKPYFLTVGSRGGYKNTSLSFKALARFQQLEEFDVFCAGHGPLEPEFLQYIGTKQVKAFKLSDDSLAAAYSGAVVLLHPSSYEGFGLPVLEAMACGCPVITTKKGSLAEVAGDAALFVREDDVEGMLAALQEVQKPHTRERLIAAGLKQAAKFSWQRTADGVRDVLLRVAKMKRDAKRNFPMVSWECNGLSVKAVS